jgi:restriction system protein
MNYGILFLVRFFGDKRKRVHEAIQSKGRLDVARKQVYVRRYYRGAGRTRSIRKRGSIEGYLLLFVVLCVGVVLLIRWLSSLSGYVYLYGGLVVLCMVALLVTLGILNVRQRWLVERLRGEEIVTISRPTPARSAPPPSLSLDPARRASLKTLGDVLTLTDREFEELVADLMRLSGYARVTRVGGAGDLCADITAYDRDGNLVVAQCKRYAPDKKVGSPEIQKFLGMVNVYHRAKKGIFVTASTFSEPARKLAEASSGMLLLVDKDQLVRWIHTSASLPS